MRNRLSRFPVMIAALALVLSAAFVSGNAADGEPPRNMTTVFATDPYKEPEIKVIIPTTGAVFINPYETPVHIGVDDESGQIVSIPSSIANLSRMPIQVDVTVSAQILDGSDMTLASYSTKEYEGTGKRAFMYFEMKSVNASLAEDPESVRWDGAYDEETDIVVSATRKRTKKNMVRLAAATKDGGISPNGAAVFHLGGDAVKYPKKAWNAKDGIQITVSFSFKALPYS